MHFVISWDIPASTTNREQYEDQLVSCFTRFGHIKPLTTYYIVQVPTQADYAAVLTGLQNIGRTIPGGFRLIVTPPMTGGRYDGLHDNQIWNSINQISG